MKDFKKATNSLETRRIRKILNEEARLGINQNSESETEEVDLQRELYPLGHYINNREEMIEQMFSIIKGAKLKKMLPPILKDMPIDELKADCLIHLIGMSKKRIRAILEGREINSSSDSESHSDSSTTPSKKPKVDLKPFVIKQEGCSDISDNSEEVVLVDPDLDFLNLDSNDSVKETTGEKKKSKRKLRKKDLDDKHKRIKTKMVEEASESDEVQQIDSSDESTSENELEIQAPKEGKTLLEILELEMRARAIRALLKNNDPQEGEEPQKAEEGISKKLSKEDSTKKITPSRNFRKKKRKNDDVIVIAPKVVTIDLTDENDQSGGKINTDRNRKESDALSLENKGDKVQTISSHNSPQTDSGVYHESLSQKGSVADETFSKINKQVISKTVVDEKSSKSDSQNKTDQSEHDKSSWAQRWLESKEVKKVVSTSKICGNIRKKIKIAKLAKKQMPVQNELEKPTPAPAKEIEGSVVEYELLSKSKTMTVNTADGVDNDIQASILSTNQEPSSSYTDTNDTPTADQVQDISSTRAENTSLLQDPVPGLQINEDETSCTNVTSDEPDINGIVTSKLNLNDEFPNTVINDEETNTPFTSDKEVDGSDFKCPNKNDDDLQNENICSPVNESLLDHDCKNLVESKEEGNLKPPQEMAPDDTSEKLNTETFNQHSNDVNKHLFSNDNKKAVANSSQISDSKGSEEELFLNNKNDIELKKEMLKIEPKNLDTQKKTVSKVSETSEKAVSHCSTKTIQELNEPEALEINITEEDRDIEDAIEETNEQNESKYVKDSIIVID